MDIKKLLVALAVVVLALCAAPASADDFLDSLDEQAVFIKQSLGMKSSNPAIDDSTIHKFLREGYTIIANAVTAISITDTVTTVANQLVYSLDSLIIRVDYVYWHGADSLMALSPISPDSFAMLYKGGYTMIKKKSQSDKFKARPKYYSWTTGKINLYPVPVIKDDEIYVEGRGRVKNIIGDSTFVADFAVNYRPLPVTYATWKTALALEMWHEANEYWKLMMFQLQILKVEVDMMQVVGQ